MTQQPLSRLSSCVGDQDPISTGRASSATPQAAKHPILKPDDQLSTPVPHVEPPTDSFKQLENYEDEEEEEENDLKTPLVKTVHRESAKNAPVLHRYHTVINRSTIDEEPRKRQSPSSYLRGAASQTTPSPGSVSSKCQTYFESARSSLGRMTNKRTVGASTTELTPRSSNLDQSKVADMLKDYRIKVEALEAENETLKSERERNQQELFQRSIALAQERERSAKIQNDLAEWKRSRDPSRMSRAREGGPPSVAGDGQPQFGEAECAMPASEGSYEVDNATSSSAHRRRSSEIGARNGKSRLAAKAEMDDEVQVMKTRMQDLKVENEKLRSLNRELVKKNSEEERKLQLKRVETADMERQLKEVKEGLEDTKKDHERKLIDLDMLQKQCEGLRESQESQQACLKSLREEEDVLQKQLVSLKQSLENKNNDLVALQSQEKDQCGRLENLKRQIEEVESQLDCDAESLASLRRQLHQSRFSFESEYDKLQLISQDIAQTSKDLEENKSQVAHFDALLNARKQEAQNLESEVTKSQLQINLLKADEEKLNAHLFDLRKERESVTNEVSVAKSDAAEASKKIADCKTQLQNLREAVATESKKLQETKESCQLALQSQTTLETRVKDLAEQLNLNQEAVLSKEAQLKSLTDQVAELEGEKTSLITDLERLKASLEVANSEHAAVMEMKRIKDEEKECVQTSISSLTSSQTDLQNVVQRLTDERTSLQASLDSLKQQIDSAKQSVEAATEAASRAKADLHSTIRMTQTLTLEPVPLVETNVLEQTIADSGLSSESTASESRDQDRIIGMEKALEETKTLLAEREEALAEKDVQLASIDAQLLSKEAQMKREQSSLENRLAALRAEISEKTKAYEELRTALISQEQRKAEIEKDYDQLRDKCDAIASQVEELESHLTLHHLAPKMNAMVDGGEERNKDVIALSEMEENGSASLYERQALEAPFQSSKAAKIWAFHEALEAKAQLRLKTETDIELNNMRQQVVSEQDTLRTVQSTVVEESSRVTSLQQEAAMLTESIERLRCQSGNLTNEEAQKRSLIESLETEKAQLELEVNARKAAMAECTSEKDALESTLTALRDAMKQAKSDEKQRAERIELDRKESHSKYEAAFREEQTELMNFQLSAARTKEGLEADIHSLQSRCNEEEQRFAKLREGQERELRELQKQAAALQNVTERAQASLEEYQKLYRQVREKTKFRLEQSKLVARGRIGLEKLREAAESAVRDAILDQTIKSQVGGKRVCPGLEHTSSSPTESSEPVKCFQPPRRATVDGASFFMMSSSQQRPPEDTTSSENGGVAALPAFGGEEYVDEEEAATLARISALEIQLGSIL